MLLAIVSLLTFADGIKIASGIIGVCSFIFGVFKVINWIKTKFTNIDSNVTELKSNFNSNMEGLRNDIKDQTQTIVNELREQRQDLRTFYVPALLQMQSFHSTLQTPQQTLVRAKRSVKKKINK